ncbi:MAG: preprotein translocase subunit SecE [Candidatus Dasytiphilus stammeri]
MANQESPNNNKSHQLEIIKWLTVISLLMIVIIGNYYYHHTILLIRILTSIFMIFTAGMIASLTNHGKLILRFFQEAKNEIFKINWPTSQETLHTTLIVTAVTAVISLILWGLDSILFHLVSLITSLRF